MATFVKGNPVANATSYELYEKVLPVTGEVESPNLFNAEIVNQYYKNGCFLAASAKWYSVASFNSTNLIPLHRDNGSAVIYIYGVKTSAEFHLTWWGESAVEEAPTADVVGTGNVQPAGGFTIKNGTNVGSGSVTMEIVTDSKGVECLKLTVTKTYNTNAKYIRLGIGTSAFTSRNDIYFCDGERYQVVESGGEITYDKLSTASEINFDVSALGLEAGEHIFVVVAKADGYADSDYSNEVVYTA